MILTLGQRTLLRGAILAYDMVQGHMPERTRRLRNFLLCASTEDLVALAEVRGMEPAGCQQGHPCDDGRCDSRCPAYWVLRLTRAIYLEVEA